MNTNITRIATFFLTTTCLLIATSAQAQNFRLSTNLGRALQTADRIRQTGPMNFGRGQFRQQGHSHVQGHPVHRQPVYQQPHCHQQHPIAQPQLPPQVTYPAPVQTVPTHSTVVQSAPKPALTKEQKELLEVRKRVASAKQFFKAGKYDDARQELDQVVELRPQDTNVYQFRSAAWYAQGEFEKAAADAYDAIRLGNLWNWKVMSDLYADTKVYTQQLRELEIAAKSHEKSMSTQFLLAYHYLMLEHFSHGEKQLNKVLAINPRETLSQKLLAAVQKRQAQLAAKK